MMHPCQNCERPAPEDVWLCKPCALHFSKLPAQARDLINLLDEPRTGLSEPRSTMTEPALPINPEAVDLRRDLQTQLRTLPPVYEHDAYLTFRELEDTVRAATRLVDIPRERLYLAPCQHDNCDGRYWHYAGEQKAICSKCESTRYDADELHDQQIAAANTYPAPPKTVAAALGINYERVKKWIQRGKLTRDHNGNITAADLNACHQAHTKKKGE